MGIFQVIEMFAGFILNFIPYYQLIRLAFFVYMAAPQTDGSLKVYEQVKPLIEANKDELEKLFDMGKNIGSHAINTVREQAKEQMNDPANMYKVAAGASKLQNQLS